MVTTLSQRLADRSPLLGAWTFLRDPIAAEIASRAGYDYVCIDGQHGLHDQASIAAQLTSIAVGGDAFPVVRVLSNDLGRIGQALDAGALGIIVPLVNTEADARAAVEACFYPPKGNRSYGPIAAGIRHGGTYGPTRERPGFAAEAVAPILMVETMEGLSNVEAIASVDGLAAIYVGPSDLGLSMGLGPGSDHDDPDFDAALARIVAACQANGVIPGIHADPSLVSKRRDQGFTFITIGYDLTPMTAGLYQDLTRGRNAT